MCEAGLDLIRESPGKWVSANQRSWEIILEGGSLAPAKDPVETEVGFKVLLKHPQQRYVSVAGSLGWRKHGEAGWRGQTRHCLSLPHCRKRVGVGTR